MKKKIGFSIAALLLCAALTACGSTTVAESLTNINAGLQVVLGIYEPAIAPAVATAFQNAITAAQNWKPGTASAEFEQVLTAVVNELDAIPLSQNVDTLIAAAINYIDNQISILQSTKSASSQHEAEAIFVGWLDTETAAPKTRHHVWHGKQLKTYSQFKSAWNQHAPANAKIK